MGAEKAGRGTERARRETERAAKAVEGPGNGREFPSLEVVPAGNSLPEAPAVG